MKRIVLATDAPYREVRHVRDTEFDVADNPDPNAKPPQVDPTTAAAWDRNGWLKPVPVAAAEDIAAATEAVETVVPPPATTPARSARGR